MGSGAWFTIFPDEPPPRLSLFCLPYAGGGAAIYRPWQALMPRGIAVRAVELPGRGRRFREPACRRIEPLADALFDALVPHAAPPFALFGHSMGAVIAYELARRFEAAGLPGPRSLIVSASLPPFVPPLTAPVHDLPDPAFIAKLRKLNGTPAEFFGNAELMDLLLPMLRADFTMLGTYPTGRAPKLHCPVAAIGGSDDSEVPWSMIEAWGEVTEGSFEAWRIEGDHFFIDRCRDALVAVVAEVLDAVMAPQGQGR